MPKSISSDERTIRTTPVFVPRSLQRKRIGPNARNGGSHFKEKQITLNPSTLPNGLIPGTVSPQYLRPYSPVPLPVYTTVTAEVHREPEISCPEDPDEAQRDASTMTVYSILQQSKPKQVNTDHNQANGFVPNGYPTGPIIAASTIDRELEPIAEETSNKHVTLKIESEDKGSGQADENETEKEIEQSVLQNKKRRGSLLSLDKMFKVRIAEKTGPSSRAPTTLGLSSRLTSARNSIVSRLSISSEYEGLRVTNYNRLSDLKHILHPEEEQRDVLKSFCDSFSQCECFEWNLNNAAKFITFVVFVLTFIMVIKELTRDR